MNQDKRDSDKRDWDGVEQRQSRRRYTIDRRTVERRKKYLWSVVFPIMLGAALSALLSWGVYVTHVTYRISANYEQTFVKHLEAEDEHQASIDHRFEVMKAEYTSGINSIRKEMTDGLKEIRRLQTNMYQLLLHQQGALKDDEANE